MALSRLLLLVLHLAGAVQSPWARPATRTSHAMAVSKYGTSPFVGELGLLGSWRARRRCQRLALPEPGEVGKLTAAKELGAILEVYGDTKFVALIFNKDKCASCKLLKAPFAAKAAEYADQGLFFEIRCEKDDAKQLCKECQLRVAPAGHIYVGGELVNAMAVGKSAWPEFARTLDEVASSCGDKHVVRAR